jgi:hypothetical protein
LELRGEGVDKPAKADDQEIILENDPCASARWITVSRLVLVIGDSFVI